MCDEFDYQCNAQIEDLQDLGGKINLERFGSFKDFAQNVITDTRRKVMNTRARAMKAAFQAVAGEYVHEVTQPLNVSI